jgi:hypothetical protein
MKTTALLSLLAMPSLAHATLPADVADAKEELIALSLANLNNWGDPAIQAQLEPHVEILADYFAANRPANEADLTIGPWRSIWYEDASFAGLNFFGIVTTDVENSYQVVEDGFYYNIGVIDVNLGLFTVSATNWLKGEYTIVDTPDASNAGERGLNAIDLEFVDNQIRIGDLPTFLPLTTIVRFIERGFVPGISVPGPIGVTGNLFNLYIDDDIRVAFGENDDPNNTTGNGLYVLIRQDFATN